MKGRWVQRKEKEGPGWECASSLWKGHFSCDSEGWGVCYVRSQEDESRKEERIVSTEALRQGRSGCIPELKADQCDQMAVRKRESTVRWVWISKQTKLKLQQSVGPLMGSAFASKWSRKPHDPMCIWRSLLGLDHVRGRRPSWGACRNCQLGRAHLQDISTLTKVTSQLGHSEVRVFLFIHSLENYLLGISYMLGTEETSD